MQRKVKVVKFFSSDVQIRIMIENEIYCHVNGFLKLNISKDTSYNYYDLCNYYDLYYYDLYKAWAIIVI